MAVFRYVSPMILLLAGCTLIDQRTFDAHAGELAKPPAVAGPPAAQPLVTVDFAHPSPDYTAALQQAVAEATSRKPDVQFDVVTVVPATGTTAQQAAAAAGLTPDAREIARAINDDGVADDRIHLSARAEGGAESRQVQVFVR